MSKERGDLYAVLGIARGATTQEVKAAFRAQAKRHHPDLQAVAAAGAAAPSAAAVAAAAANFRRASDAYEVLGDADARRAYDRENLSAGFGGAGAGAARGFNAAAAGARAYGPGGAHAADMDAAQRARAAEYARKFAKRGARAERLLYVAAVAGIAAALTPSAAGFAFACDTDAACSLNGVCEASVCVCDDAWLSAPGAAFGCSVLNVQRPARGTGLHSLDDGHNSSSWGGSVLFDNRTGIYHMFASQMVNHCGINSWTENSHVIRATSAPAGGAYTRVDDARSGEIFAVFSHEPNAVRDPTTGEWAIFFTYKVPSTRPICNCTDGSTVPRSCGKTKGEGPTFVSWSAAPEGPWTEPLLLIDTGGRQADTNLAPVILANGSLVGIWRNSQSGSTPHLVTATHWKNASSYVFDSAELFPTLGSLGAEDPALYFDRFGRYHALFHNLSPCVKWPCPEVAGGHAFSEDGQVPTANVHRAHHHHTLTLAPDPASIATRYPHNRIAWNYTGIAYNNSGFYDDGTPFVFSRRERPHPVFAADGVTIVAITTGVEYSDATTNGTDATFTFLQPVGAAGG